MHIILARLPSTGMIQLDLRTSICRVQLPNIISHSKHRTTSRKLWNQIIPVPMKTLALKIRSDRTHIAAIIIIIVVVIIILYWCWKTRTRSAQVYRSLLKLIPPPHEGNRYSYESAFALRHLRRCMRGGLNLTQVCYLYRNLQDFPSFHVIPCFKGSPSAWCAIEAGLGCRNFHIFRKHSLVLIFHAGF